MTCPDCQGPVDVVTMNGGALRCGCGHTTVTVAPAPTAPIHRDLQGLLAVLRANHVSGYKAKDLEITLDPSAWRTEPTQTAEPIPPDDNCACGHAYHDHNATGCVMGCPLESCGKPEEKAA